MRILHSCLDGCSTFIKVKVLYSILHQWNNMTPGFFFFPTYMHLDLMYSEDPNNSSELLLIFGNFLQQNGLIMVWTINNFNFVLQLNYYFEQNYYFITGAEIFFGIFYIWTLIPWFESGYSTANEDNFCLCCVP